jgi:hypothetical protein
MGVKEAERSRRKELVRCGRKLLVKRRRDLVKGGNHWRTELEGFG